MRFFIRRLIQLIFVMLAASFFTFGMAYLAPSDPAEMVLMAHDTMPTEEALEKLREEMGLNKAFIQQYGSWLGNVIQGDLGESYTTGESVLEKCLPRLGMTVKLALISFIFLIVVSFSLGILSATQKGKWVDYGIRLFSFSAISMPSFWLGMLLIYFFAVKCQWFKISGEQTLSSMILPGLSLSIPLMGRYIRIIRSAVLDEYSKDYVLGERSRGASEWAILLKNVLPNSLLSVITLLGLSAALLLGGTVIIESIFSLQGLGTLALQSITNRDYPVLQAYVLFMSTTYVSINFIVDMISQAIDPKLRENTEC